MMKKFYPKTIGTFLLTSLISFGDRIDRDGDGNSDIWQTTFKAPSLNPDGDADGDGHSNGDEATAGTDPLDPNSFFQIIKTEVIETEEKEDTVELTFLGVAGKNYQFQQSPSMQPRTWENVGPEILISLNGEVTREVPKPAGEVKYFYRALVYDRDQDGDGVSAADEFTVGTSDDDPNSGGDGTTREDDCDVASQWLAENDYGTNPGGSQANLREVDVAFLQSSSIGGTNFSFIVTAAGTGSFHQLTSWNLPSALSKPSLLHTTPPIDGFQPKIRKIPVGNSLLGQPRFLTGTIRASGDLFLSSRQLNLGGAFTHHDSVGYGSNVGVDVFDYDIAVRTFSKNGLITHHHLVTPVMVKDGSMTKLHIVTWSLNASTGQLNGLHDSGPLPMNFLPLDAKEGRLKIEHMDGIQYVVTYTGSHGILHNHFIFVTNDGTPNYGGGHRSGEPILGGDNVLIDQQENALAQVTSSGFLTAHRDEDGTFGMSVWERRSEGFLNWEPYLLTNDSEDLAPAAKGVFPKTPKLTDSWKNAAQAGGFASQALTVGDFNGDGRDDVAIGVPGQSINGNNNTGQVYIIQADSDGLLGLPLTQTWSQNTSGIVGAPELGDRFGDALAAGDFNNDGNMDLAIGVPGEDVNGNAVDNAGAVNIIYGTPFGLSTTNNFIIQQEDLGNASVAFDSFGSRLATGDFDNDGFDDLAISAASREVGEATNAGAVYVLWGDDSGLKTAGSEYIHQNVVGIFDSAEDFDQFGLSLAAGDFNGNGNDDLAVGIPFEDIGNVNNAGAVQVFYGANGEEFNLNNFISQGGFTSGEDIRGAVEEIDLFGRALAVGDFDNDGADDLAIGVPGEDDGDIEDAGAVNVLYGTFLGLTHLNNVIITQGGFNPGGGSLPSSSETDDDFGRSLATCDLDGDDFDDLIIGAPHEGVSNSAPDAGAIFTIRGGDNGLVSSMSQFIHQGTASAIGSPKTGDRYGETLAAGDFDADGNCDLIVGIPRKDREDDNNQGAIHIMQNSDDGLLQSSSDNEEWFARTTEKARGMVTDLAWEDDGGIGAGQLFKQDTSNEWVHIASVTKCMTLLLAVEAIEDGTISLWDDVPVSELAGATGGSTMNFYDPPSAVPPTTSDLGGSTLDDDGNSIAFLAPGDTMPLNFLIHAMMMKSCNRSSAAIAQYVADQVMGDPLDFIIMMNDRAIDLGMTTPALDALSRGTRFGHPAHGCVTTPQALINLLREGSKHPLFLQFASQSIYGDTAPNIELCGTDIMGDLKCNNPFGNIQSLSSYPGRLAWKGGNGGQWWSNSQANNVPARPSGISWCTTAQVGIVERAGRTLLMSLQQTGSNGTDTQNLFNFGFKKVFTPDRLAERDFPMPGGIVGPDGPIRVKDFAIDKINSRLCVTAIIDDFEELKLNIWDTNFGSGTITPRESETTTYSLLNGAQSSPATTVDMIQVETNSAIGDYFTASQDGNHLNLKLWRIGETP